MCYTFAICSWSRETDRRGTGGSGKDNGPPSAAQSAQSETQNVIRYLLALIFFSSVSLDVVIVVNKFFGLFRIARIQNEPTCAGEWERAWKADRAMLSDNLKMMIKIIDSIFLFFSFVRSSRYPHCVQSTNGRSEIDVFYFSLHVVPTHKTFANIFSIYITYAGKYFDSEYNFILSDIVCTARTAIQNWENVCSTISSNCLHSQKKTERGERENGKN